MLAGKLRRNGKDRSVSVKRSLYSPDPKCPQFLSEAAVLVNLQHPNIVELVGVTTTGSLAYIILEDLSIDDLLTALQLDKGRQIAPQMLTSFAKQVIIVKVKSRRP